MKSPRNNFYKAKLENELQQNKSASLVQGEIVNAANLLHAQFFMTFMIALGKGRLSNRSSLRHVTWIHPSRALWHLSQSDKFQREMAVTAITSLPFSIFEGWSTSKIVGVCERYVWAQKRADSLAGARNLVAHSPISFRHVVKVPGAKGGSFSHKLVPAFGGPTTRPEHLRRLQRIEGLELWRGLRNDMLKMKDYLYELNEYVIQMPVPADHDRPPTLPRKPRLPSLARFQAIEAQLAREAQQARQASLPKPSRGKSHKKPSRPRR